MAHPAPRCQRQQQPKSPKDQQRAKQPSAPQHRNTQDEGLVSGQPQPSRHPGRAEAVQLVLAFPAKPRRQRPVHPYAAANALALEHRDIADTVAANISRRTGHPRDDLQQVAMLGILQAARRYTPQRGPFRPFARTYANGEVYHYLRDKGFLIKVPASWRELHARGQKLLRMGTAEVEVPEQLKISAELWREIALACRQRVVAIEAQNQEACT